MEPRIQYTKTGDGVSIAYQVEGDGAQTLVYMPMPLTRCIESDARLAYLQTDWRHRLGRGRRVVRFDFRGSGYSDRDVSDFSLDRMEFDLAAVVESVGGSPVAIWAELDSGPIAISYAVHNPNLVDTLVLWCSWARDADIGDRSTWEVLDEMIITNPRRYFEFIVTSAGRVPASEAKRAAEVMAGSIEPGTLKAFMDQVWNYDVTSLLASVKCRTMVLHPNGQDFFQPALATRLAAGIPGADLRMIECDTLGVNPEIAPYVGDLLDGFLGVEIESQRDPSPQSPATGTRSAALQTILFTDVEGSTALTDRLGDAAARELLREHERITREQLRAHGGSEVKTMGDGFMASFGSATRALECAIAIQKAFTDPEPTVGAKGPSPLRSDHGIKVRCGLNAGEPIAEDDPDGRSDLFGTAVIVAARIAAQAHGGEILVSDVVRQLVAGKRFLFNDRGEHALKGFEDPVRVFEVSWRE
jgi:class 3 adenylate cyclase/pimeloyl-ACP methyl ester carboxylesterase